MAQVFISWKGGGFAIAVLPDFSPFAWWHDNALPTATPAPLSRLRLTSMCSDEPANVRVWRVRNPNPVDVLVTWHVLASDKVCQAPPHIKVGWGDVYAGNGTWEASQSLPL